MTLLLSPRPPAPEPTQKRSKTSLITLLKTAPVGKFSYNWWLNYFQTAVKDNWDT